MRNLAGVGVCRTAKRVKGNRARGKEKGAGADTFAKSDKKLLIKNCLIALLA